MPYQKKHRVIANASTEISPVPFQYLIQKGMRLNQEHHFKEAIFLLEETYFNLPLEHQKELADTAYFLGGSYKEIAEYQNALKYFEKAYEIYFILWLKKQDEGTLYYLINCCLDLLYTYQLSNQSKKIFSILSEIKSQNLPDILLSSAKTPLLEKKKELLANIYLLSAEHSEPLVAQSDLQHALDLNPNQISAYIKLGIIEIDLNNHTKAKEVFMKALEMISTSKSSTKTQNADCVYHLARCELKLKETENALHHLHNAYNLYGQSNDQEAKSATEFGLALAYYQKKEIEKGVFYLQKALYAFQGLALGSEIATANQIILDWCEKSDFSTNFCAQETTEGKILKNLLHAITFTPHYTKWGTLFSLLSKSSATPNEKNYSFSPTL